MVEEMLAFWRARLEEDEQAAEAACGGDLVTARWKLRDHPLDSAIVWDGRGDTVVYDEGVSTDEEGAHIVRHDPARVLRDVQADRALLAELEAQASVLGGSAPYAHCLKIAARCRVSVWSDHPDYRAEWAV